MSSKRRTAKGNRPREYQHQFDWRGQHRWLRLWLTDSTHVKHLLRVLFDHADVHGECFLRVETIAKEMSSSPRTVKRATSDAVRDGLILKLGPKEGRNRVNCNLYKLRVAEIRERAEAELAQQAGGQPGPCQGPNRPLRGANLAPEGGQVGPQKDPLLTTPEDLPLSQEGEDEAIALVCVWLQDGVEVVRTAINNGCSSAQIVEAVREVEKRIAAGRVDHPANYLRTVVANLPPAGRTTAIDLATLPADDLRTLLTREAQRNLTLASQLAQCSDAHQILSVVERLEGRALLATLRERAAERVSAP